MTLGTIWEQVVGSNELTESDLHEIALWAKRVYFGPNNEGKRWYRDGVTEDNVLLEFLTAASPISPEALVEVWKAIPVLQSALERLDHGELDNVERYLNRSKEPDTTARYTQGDVTLKEMALSLGGITGTMVNKLFTSGADKLTRLTGGVSPMDMEDDALNEMVENVNAAQVVAAAEYASSLLSFKGDVKSFIQSQVTALNLTEIEARAVTQDEIDGLSFLSEMEHARVMLILLEDLESNDNLFLGFQNAASKKVFPRRSGRPKGSGKKKVQSFEDDDTQEPVEI